MILDGHRHKTVQCTLSKGSETMGMDKTRTKDSQEYRQNER